ncbi:MAG: MFS transporter [Opitutaceae bacterium]
MSDPAQSPRLGFVEKLGYGLGDTASNFVFHTFNIFLFYYYTDVFGLSAGVVGTLFLVARLWDAVNDPMMGVVADRTRTRWGKYRPYLLWMAVPYGIMGYVMFANPDLSVQGKLVYAYVTYTLMMMAYTAINIPYSALMGVMTPSSSERTVLSSYRFVCAFTGQLLITFSARPLVALIGQGDEAAGFKGTMAIFAVCAIGLFLFTFAVTRERVHPPVGQKSNLKQELRFLVANRPWLILFAAAIFTLANVAVRGAVTLHYFKYFVGDDGSPFIGFLDRSTIFMTSGTLALILGVACTKLFSKRWGKRELMVGLTLANAATMAAFFFIPPENFWLMMLVNIVGTFIVGPTPALVWAMYADVADYGEWKFQRRSTALIFSAAQFAQKLGLTIGGFLAGWMLQFAGFVPNQVQSESSLLGIRVMFTFIPAAFAVFSAVAVWCYPLREDEVARVERELAARHAGDPE